jgi:predicted GNAT family acetyltransferase
MNAEVSNNPTEYRYELWADGELAGYTQYSLGRGRIAFVHTEIYESYEEGMGLGTRLGRAALDDARQGTGGSALLPVHRAFHRAPRR